MLQSGCHLCIAVINENKRNFSETIHKHFCFISLIFQVSEGLDFADHAGRAVVITGMPFATMTDPKVS